MIGLIGINHHTAPVEVRERYALTPTDAVGLVETWKSQRKVLGAIVLSTCNRIEIYFECKQKTPPFEDLIASFAHYKGIGEIDSSIFVCRQGEEAIVHLFRLASGLESMVLGETQILGQLKDAYRKATENVQSTSVLSRMFHKAFETAKKIRSKYIVSAIPISSGASAVSFMSRKVPNRQISTLIIGAGQMSETIYEALKREGYTDIKLYNRTLDRAARFATAHDNMPFFAEGELVTAIVQADLIFVATSSLMPIITPNELSTYPADKTLWLFDMAVPRNIDNAVGEMSYTKVYTIDDLKQTPEGEGLGQLDDQGINDCIDEMVQQFLQWMDASQIRQVINVIQQASDQLLEKEVAKLPNHLDEASREMIIQYNQHMRITFSTAVIAAMRDVTDDGRNMKYTEAINSLFGKILEMERQ